MNASRSLRRFFWLSFISNYVQDWIRKEIVDDDPCDDVSYFPVKQELDIETSSVSHPI